MSITTEQIKALKIEAGAAGDGAQVELCKKALDGDRKARAACEKAIQDAQAMDDQQ